jgi:hypothetical protein
MSGTRLRTGEMLFAALAAAVALVVWSIFAPREAAGGWLIGFLFWSQIPIGSLVLSMTHTLTGGRWGLVLRPVLAPATAAVPWLFVAMVPVFIAVPALYPWVQHADAVKPDVAAHYLNTPFFIGRSVIALAVLSVLALLIRRAELRGGLLTAGFGLLLYGVTISSVALIGSFRSSRHLSLPPSAPASASCNSSPPWRGPPFSAPKLKATARPATSADCCSSSCLASPTSISWPIW